MSKIDTTVDKRHAADELAIMEQEILDAIAHGDTDVELLWKDYIELHLEIHGTSVSEEDVEGMTNYIIEQTAHAQEIRNAIPGLDSLTRQLITSRGEYLYPENARPTLNQAIDADPVMLHSGQYVHTATDVNIDGVGIRCVFDRTYRSQGIFHSALGNNWDHRYNLFLDVTDQHITKNAGSLKEEIYTRHTRYGQTGFSYWVPPAGVHAVIYQQSDHTFLWRGSGGTVQTYENDPSYARRYRLKRIQNRFGNFLEFTYQDSLLVSIIINHPSRVLRLFYDGTRLVSIRDFTTGYSASGREWRYEHDYNGNLVSVTLPSTEHHPHGSKVCYEYGIRHRAGRLTHQMERIIDAEGVVYIENEYGLDSGLISHGRVIRQRQGDGEWLFEYRRVVDRFDDAVPEIDRPVAETTVIGPRGNINKHLFNRHGNLLLKETATLHGGRPATLSHRMFYNSDGALVAQVFPDGAVIQSYFGRDDFARRHSISQHQADNHPELSLLQRLAFGNLLSTVRRARRINPLTATQDPIEWRGAIADVLVSDDPDDIVVKHTYETEFQLPLTESNPRFTKDPDPAVTSPPREDQNFIKTLTRYEYIGVDKRLKEVVYPDAELPDGTLQTGNVTRYLAYDAKGRVLRKADPEQGITEFKYYPETDGLRAGYTRASIVDPDGLNIRTDYEVDELGQVTATTGPYTSADAAKPRHQTRFDSQGRVLEKTGPAPFSYQSRYRYDANGNVVRTERDLKDKTGVALAGGVMVRTFRHDANMNIIEESRGGANIGTHIITRHRYDADGNRTKTVRADQSELIFKYDDRGNQVAVTHAACTDYASTNRMRYNLRDELEAHDDGLGHTTHNRYDVFGRLVEVEDPLGHITLKSYDKSGNLRLVRSFERLPSGQFRLMNRTQREFDALDRLTTRRESVFDTTAPVTDPHSAFVNSPGPGTVVTTRYWHDRNGNLTREIDGNGNDVVKRFDTANRLVETIDPLGNRTRYEHDARGNVIRQEIHQISIDGQTGAETVSGIFVSTSSYDSLNRISKVADAAGNAIHFEYDSTGKVVSTHNDLGNKRSFEYDVFGRKVSESSVLSDTGIGEGTVQTISTTRFEYDALDRLIATVDAAGNRVEQEYDPVSRLTRVRRTDGSDETFEYDPEDNLTTHRDARGVTRRFTYDDNSQLTLVMVDYSGAAAAGPTSEHWTYDGLGRPVEYHNDYVTVESTIDSLGRTKREKTTLHIAHHGIVLNRQFEISRDYDAMGNVVSLRLPSQRRLQYAYDELGRLTQIKNIAQGQGYPGSTHFPNNYAVLRSEYTGLLRARSTYGNGASTSYLYDGGQRLIATTHISASSETVFRQQQLCDAAGRVRLRYEAFRNYASKKQYWFNSIGWLTRVEQLSSATALDLSGITPPTTPLVDGSATTQSQINSRLGNLDDDPGLWSYQYDLVGNRKVQRSAPSQPPLAYQTNSLHQYASVGSYVLNYDLDGNLTRKRSLNLYYDHRNQITQVRDHTTGDVVARYYYDASGHRIVEATDSNVSFFVFDDQNIAEIYENGNLHTQFVHETAMDAVVQIVTNGSEYWAHRDLVSSVRALTDENGTEVGRYRYDEFGTPIETPAVSNRLTFMGRKYDAVTQSYDFRQRQYDPELGRFCQRDPANSVNPYVFVNNNPLASIDPSGRDREEVLGNFDFARNLSLNLDVGEYEMFIGEQSYIAQIEAIEAEYADKTEEIGTLTSLLLYHPYYEQTRWWADRARSMPRSDPNRYAAQMWGGFAFVGNSLSVGGDAVLGLLGAANHYIDPKGHMTRDLMLWSASSPIPFDDAGSMLLRGTQYLAMGSRTRFLSLGNSMTRLSLSRAYSAGGSYVRLPAKPVPFDGRLSFLNRVPGLKRYEAYMKVSGTKGTPDYLNSLYHEKFHKFVAENFPSWYRAKHFSFRGRPVGALIEYGEEVAAYTVGNLRSRQFGEMRTVFADSLTSVMSNNTHYGAARAMFVMDSRPYLLGGGLLLGGGAGYTTYRLTYGSNED